MSYPHVRVAAPGRIEYFQTADEFASSASWSEREATGWVRTEGIEPRVFHSARDKLHLAGGWVRYNAEDEPILSNRVVYVLSKVQGFWGVQARFACGATATWKETVNEEPRNVVNRFLQFLKGGDVRACAGLIRFPFIFVGTRTVRRFASENSFMESLRPFNLIRVDIDELKSIQNGQQGANVALSLARNDGRPNHAVFLSVRQDEDYRLAAISLISS